MDDDLNLSGALAGVFNLVNAGFANAPRGADAAAALAALRRFDQVLDVLTEDAPAADRDDDAIEELVRRRNEARAAKDWPRADALRDELTALGVELLDGKHGQAAWRRIGV